MLEFSRLVAALIWVLLVVHSAGLATAQKHSPASDAPASEAGGKNASDTSLEKAIRKRFAASKIGANGFTVQVANGIAILRGQTDVAQHKGVATRLARLAGAKDVVNQITITAAGKEKLRRAREKKKPASAQRTPPSKTASQPDDDDEKAVAVNGGANNESPRESSRVNAPATIPKFKITPSARRGESRSERRRY